MAAWIPATTASTSLKARIVDRTPYDGYIEQDEHAFDESMPKDESPGGVSDAEEVSASALVLGDEVWVLEFDGRWKHYPMVGIAEDGVPLIARFDHDGDWCWNPSNHVKTEAVLIVPRK